MKLGYYILWIDNDLQEYIDNNSVKDVEDFLIENGFEPHIEKVFDEAFLDHVIDKHNYDLIISDYNLENTTGDVIIEKIRNEKQLDTEILFYTAQTENSFKNKNEVRERLAFIERLTFQIGRDTLLDKIEKVIKLTLNKLLELNATRGLITAATSDLDVEIEEVVMQLIVIHKKSDEDLKAVIKDKVFSKLERNLARFWENYDSFQSYFHKIDAIKKWEIFRELLKPLKDQPEIKSFLDNNKTYQDQVIKIRNQFAHARAITNVNGLVALKGQLGNEDFEFTEQNCIEIRKNLISHKNHIERLREALNAI